jgi:hypothetical protein
LSWPRGLSGLCSAIGLAVYLGGLATALRLPDPAADRLRLASITLFVAMGFLRELPRR